MVFTCRGPSLEENLSLEPGAGATKVPRGGVQIPRAVALNSAVEKREKLAVAPGEQAEPDVYSNRRPCELRPALKRGTGPESGSCPDQLQIAGAPGDTMLQILPLLPNNTLPARV